MRQCTFLLLFSIWLVPGELVTQEIEKEKIARSDVQGAEKLAALKFTAAERDSLLSSVEGRTRYFKAIHEQKLRNAVPPALVFNPLPQGRTFDKKQRKIRYAAARQRDIPADLEQLAFSSIGELAELIRTQKVSSLALTQMYLSRLKRFDDKLLCTVTLLEERALSQARKADAEIAAGRYRGPLHGIPYGAKDLLALPGEKTTWGAAPFKDQVLDETATVFKKLDEAGAVLLAKLTLGALAMGDVWYGGRTRNPWDLEQGSSGSSAGSAAATAAGLVAFAIGTETMGSIVSPSTRCGVTGLRPTYGRVSRTGAMALSWTMDKIGPIGRTVEDCAMVFDAIRGPDNIDQTLIDLPFNYDADAAITSLRVGYLKGQFEKEYANKDRDAATLLLLQELGVTLIPIELPDMPVSPLRIILEAEAAAAFDALTRSNSDDLLVRQSKRAWPNLIRSARFIPAVEYINANRLRYQLIQEMNALFDKIDVYVAPSFGGPNLLMTNLTSHPCVVVPNGFNEKGSPTSISFIGDLFGEADALLLAGAYQNAAGFHHKQPAQFATDSGRE